MKTIEFPSKVFLFLSRGTIAVISLTIVISLLSMIFNWSGAPIPLPVLHVANFVCLANIILMCMQKRSKIFNTVNKITLVLLSPAYIFALYMCVLRLFSMDNMLLSIRKAMLMQNFAYFILCVIVMIYYFLPTLVALVNSIFVFKSSKPQYHKLS